ncbi:hypothetical protein ABK040_012768 [Willaertia magna]
MELSESTPLSIPNNNTNLIGYNNTDTISENKLDFQYHDQYLTEIDNDSTKHLLTTHDGGKPVKKPFLPNFRRMTKKEKVFTVLNTSKFLILTITFLLFGIFFSIHDETSSENTTHILALSNVSPIFLYFKSKDGPLERFTMNGEIPLLGNENLYELRKYHLENNLNIDWNITFQLQRSELQFDKLQNIENDIFEEENRYIDVVNETFTLPFVLKIQSKNNTVNKNQSLDKVNKCSSLAYSLSDKFSNTILSETRVLKYVLNRLSLVKTTLKLNNNANFCSIFLTVAFLMVAGKISNAIHIYLIIAN